MKSQKMPSGKGGPSHKAAAATSSSSQRKSRWESSSDKANAPSSDSKPSKPSPAAKDEPSGQATARGPSATGHLLPPPSAGSPFPLHPDAAGAPSPPPAYGFHMLERRTIVLADGSVRSYFALPPDPPVDPADRFMAFGHGGPRGVRGPEPGVGLGFDRHFPGPHGSRFSPEDFREPPPYGRGGGGPQHDYWASLGLDGPRGPPEGLSSLKRKFGEEDEFAWHRQHVMQYGNPNTFPSGSGDRADYLGRPRSPLQRDHLDDVRFSKHAKLGGDSYDDLTYRRGKDNDNVPPVTIDVSPQALNRAFLRFSKTINENASQKKNYLDDGRNGPLSCLACGRTSKEFPDVHGLIMHANGSQNADLRADHLGLHKAVCVLMGWNYAKAPENSKAYQSLSAADATANREDLILWPPVVIIHNTNSGRRKDGRMDGMGNKEMDNKLKELGFGGGKAKSLYGKEGHLGVTFVKFATNPAGLKEAERLAEFFGKENHGRKGWARAQASQSGDDDDDEKNPAIVKVDGKSGEKKRIFYGYLAIASDLDKVDFDMRKKAVIKSRRDSDLSD